MRTNITVALVALSAASACQAKQPIPRLTNGQATTAIRALSGLDSIKAVLGTCKPVKKNAAFAGQTACTVLAVSSGGTSESQADFHWSGKEWVATPSESQSMLPFPDPVLKDIDPDTKIDPNAGPIH